MSAFHYKTSLLLEVRISDDEMPSDLSGDEFKFVASFHSVQRVASLTPNSIVIPAFPNFPAAHVYSSGDPYPYRPS